jgi:putative heme transporter
MRYRARMSSTGRPMSIWDVISRREARLLFWLALIALFGIVLSLLRDLFSALAGPAIILFVAWLMSYVLEPPVSWLRRHLPTKGRGIPVAITYVITGVTAFVVIGAAIVAVVNAAVEFVDALPTLIPKIGEALEPLFDLLGITMPSGGSVVAALQAFLTENAATLTDALRSIVSSGVTIVIGLITAVFISMGLAVGQVSLLGWLRRFLPTSTYRDLTELESAIAVSFGGFVRGRLVIGAIFGGIVGLAAIVFGVPFAPLIAVVAGLIVFIPWIGPLIGWAVLPAFASILEPSVVLQCAIVSIVAAVAVQLVVTQFVMGAAVKMSPVAVFVVVIIGTALAGILGAIFAIPTAAAILAVTDYLKERDVLLRAADVTDLPTDGSGAPTGDAI